MRRGWRVVSVELGPVIAAAREALTDRGIPGASLIPDTSRSLVLVESSHLAQVQRGLTCHDAVATWLPWLALGLVLAAVATAVRHWRTLAAVAGGAVVAALAVSVGDEPGEVRGIPEEHGAPAAG